MSRGRKQADFSERIERKLRLGKLDSLFLFVPALLGMALALLQYYLGIIGKQSAVIAFIPILIASIAMPVYVGYYRGGILLQNDRDSIVERARGWIYLVNGIASCLIPASSYSSYVGFAGLVILYLCIFLSASRLGTGILSLFGEKAYQADRGAFYLTAAASLYLGGGLYLAFQEIQSVVMVETPATSWSHLSKGGLAIAWLTTFFWCERIARRRMFHQRDYFTDRLIPLSIFPLSVVPWVLGSIGAARPELTLLLFACGAALIVGLPIALYVYCSRE